MIKKVELYSKGIGREYSIECNNDTCFWYDHCKGTDSYSGTYEPIIEKKNTYDFDSKSDKYNYYCLSCYIQPPSLWG